MGCFADENNIVLTGCPLRTRHAKPFQLSGTALGSRALINSFVVAIPAGPTACLGRAWEWTLVVFWGMMVGMFQKPDDTHISQFIEQIQLHYGNQKRVWTSLTWRFDRRWSIWANSAVTEGGDFPNIGRCQVARLPYSPYLSIPIDGWQVG